MAAPGDPKPHFLLLAWGSPGWARQGTQLPPSDDPAAVAQLTRSHQMPRPCDSGDPSLPGEVRGWEKGRGPPCSHGPIEPEGKGGHCRGLGQHRGSGSCVLQ